MKHDLQEPLKGLFDSSRLMILDFSHIPENTPAEEDIRVYFAACEQEGVDPREPHHRQVFNNRMLAFTKDRYLVSRYGEDRTSMLSGSAIAKEGRVLHLGIDVFSKNLETVYAPCDGEIIAVGQEPQNHSFGHYMVFRPTQPGIPAIFLGHLAAECKRIGPAKAGEPIARIGDFVAIENGGWSRHLHIQMHRDPPTPYVAPPGYSTVADFAENQQKYPDPQLYLPDWQIKNQIAVTPRIG